MTGIITSIEVRKGTLPLVDICGSLLSPPYVVPQTYYVCITAYIKNTGSETEEYQLEMLDPQGNIIDREPDTYWVNVAPNSTVSVTVSAALMYAGQFNFSVRLRRCVCTSWTGCILYCDSKPIDAVRNIQVATSHGTQPPPPVRYYDCISGACQEVYYPTQYPGDPTCNQACAGIPPLRWKCYGDGDCSQSSTGTYDTYDECMADCQGGPPPPPPTTPKYYKCIDGQCTKTPEQTQYVNDRTCGGTCYPAPIDEDTSNMAFILAGIAGFIGIGLAAIISKRRKQKLG